MNNLQTRDTRNLLFEYLFCAHSEIGSIIFAFESTEAASGAAEAIVAVNENAFIRNPHTVKTVGEI